MIEKKVGLNLNREALAILKSCGGHMPLPAYRIHDTTNHLFMICLSFVNQFVLLIVYDLFMICLSYSSVVVLLFIHQSINHQSLVTSYFTYHYQLIYQLNYH